MTVRRAALALPVAALVLLTACGTDSPDAAAPGDDPVVSIQTSQPSAGAVPASPPDAPSPSARVIDVTLAGGTVTGVSSRVEAALGERLVLRITSDVADEVHVHGYDERAVLPAGGTVEIPLTADIPGGFEVELEGSGKLLFQLRVA